MLEVQNLDQVLIERLTFDASIGVFDWEKKIKQTLVFDLQLNCDFSAAAESDEIADAIDYVAVSEEIERVTLAKHYQLLECLANDITAALFDKFSITALVLTIGKPGAVAKAQSVGVRISRQRPVAAHG